MKKSIIFAALAALVSIAGCTTTLTVVPRSADQCVLYVMRVDAPLSEKDTVAVYLNGREVTGLLMDEYKALHILPGTYEIEFIVTTPDGRKETATKFEVPLKPNDCKIAIIRYVMGWKDPRRFQDARNLSVFSRMKNGGEFDVTGTVKPD